MAITVTLIGTGVEQAAAGGTNASNTVTSQSATWNAGDYALVSCGVHHNAIVDLVITGITSSGGTLGTADIRTTTPNLAMGGYKSGSSMVLVQVASGFTGTLTVTRTASGTPDHWLTATFFKVTGVNGTIVQAASNNQAAGTTTLALNLASAPASTSLVMAQLVCNSNDAWSTLAGFTEIERAETSWLADHSCQYINTGAAQNNTFTVAANGGGIAGIIVEIADATGAPPDGFVGPTRRLGDPRIPPRSMWVDSPVAGTVFSQSVAGSISPSGALANQARKALAGSTTPSGALAKAAAKALAGTSTPSGAISKLVAKLLAGSTTPSGTLANTKVVLLNLAGSITPSGALTKQARKSLAGSITPSGALAKADAKALAGSTTPTGAVAKRANKALAGSTTPSGVLTTTRVLLRAFAGSITPSGALAKVANKSLAGSAAPSGALAKRTSKSLAGSITPSGTLAKLARKAFAGAITALGNLTTAVIGPVGIPIGGGLDTYVTAMGAADAYVNQMGAADTYAVQMGAADASVRPIGGADAYTTTLGGI